MEILVVIAYAAILALVAPFVFPPSEHYGKLVPAGIALVSGAGAWLTLTWLGFPLRRGLDLVHRDDRHAACCVVWHQSHRGNQEKSRKKLS
jgi:hypothetical protein